MVDVSGFRNAMSRLGGAVSVITTDGPAGRFGFTASAGLPKHFVKMPLQEAS